MKNKNIIKSYNPITVDKNMIRLLGVKNATLLSVLINIHNNSSYLDLQHGEWIKLSVDEISESYLLTKDEQQKVIDELTLNGLIEFKITGLPRRKTVKLNTDLIYRIMLMTDDEIDNLRESNKLQSYLYLFLNKNEGKLKIGKSKNPKNRIKELGSIYLVELESLFEIEKCGEIEEFVLNKFSKYNLHGEWFSFNQEIVDYFSTLKSVQENGI